MEVKFRKAALWVLACGVILRVALALVNDDANDDHMSVIRIIAYENRMPERGEVKEAFQPKLYHATVAVLLKVVRPQSKRAQMILAQMVSCAAGILTLLLAYRFFMGEVEVSEKVRFISFAMLALNPPLIGINGQATNDSFVILFASLAFYFAWLFFRSQRTSDFCWMSTFAILAGLSKGNGLVIFVALLAVFAMAVGWTRENYDLRRSRAALYAVIFLLSYSALVPTLGPYWTHYRRYGSAFAINQEPDPFPVSSLAESLGTFRIGELLRNPVIKKQPDNIHPVTQTSLASELYGRAHFVHFDSWPPTWQLPNWQSTREREWISSVISNDGRLIFLCALLPTALMLAGLLRSLISAGRMFVRRHQAPKLRLTDWLLLFTTVGYILFIVAVRLRFRDFGAMKAIYVFPGLLGFLTLFARECDRFYALCMQKRILQLSADTIIMALLFFYVLDVTALIGQLTFSLTSSFLHAT
jgi:hypothetical protein